MRRFVGRRVLLSAAFAIVATSCGGSATPTTLLPETTTTTNVSATTSSTVPAVADTTTSSTTTTTTLPPSGPPLIQEGDRNETVAAFQFLLNCNSYGTLTVDGAFGPATLAAVEAAQTALGRVTNGIPDGEMLAELSRRCTENRRIEGDELVTVVGNAAPVDPEVFAIALLSGSTLSATITLGLGHVVTVRGTDGSEVAPETTTTWVIDNTQDYLIEVSSPSGPILFELAVNVTAGVQEAGDWILATDGVTYRGTELALGGDAQTIIDKVFDFLGHGIRGAYEEFDTDWYAITSPQEMGLRGIFIEGFAWLFFGPDPSNVDRPETFERWRFEGPSDDADGNPRAEDYATTAEGITVGDTLADLQATYGGDVSSGSNSSEHYYRLSNSGGEMCFYFGASAPASTTAIVEIASECRS